MRGGTKMQDTKLREAFRALVKYLNLRVDDYMGYDVRNNPPNSGCNVARMIDIENLQDQIDILASKKNKRVKRRK